MVSKVAGLITLRVLAQSYFKLIKQAIVFDSLGDTSIWVSDGILNELLNQDLSPLRTRWHRVIVLDVGNQSFNVGRISPNIARELGQDLIALLRLIKLRNS
jgi:hypothetical protein